MDDPARQAWMQAKPRFISDAIARRLVLRGVPIVVVRDPVTGRHWRLAMPLYRLATLLDGRRTVAEAISLAGDDQGLDAERFVRELASMAKAGLLRLPGLKTNRPKPTTVSSLNMVLQRTLFVRFEIGNLRPIIPYARPVLGWLYTRTGAIVLASLLLATVWAWAAERPAIAAQFERLSQLGVKNVVMGWLMFAAAKMAHEVGHAVAANRAGASEGLHIESFRWGISLMYLMPAPYVDVSPAWLIASRWKRAQIGLAGIQVDLLVASIAGLAWSQLGAGFVADRLFELVLLCGASSLLFNANPLVRLDGYYVLSDILEISNLQPRGSKALGNLLKWPLGLSRGPRSVSDLGYAAYSAASWTWRWSIFVAIFWFTGGVSPTIAFLFAGVIVFLYCATPLARGLKNWVSVVRTAPGRATVAPLVIGAVSLFLLFFPVPVYVVGDGIVWNEGVTSIFSPADGLLRVRAPAGAMAGSAIELDNPELRSTLIELRAEREAVRIAARRARVEAPEKADSFDERLRAVSSQIAAEMKEMSSWRIEIPKGAVWHPLRAESMSSAWLRRDDPRPLGLAIAPGPVVLRVFLDQWDGPAALAALAGSAGQTVPVRRRGETRASFSAVVTQLPTHARDELPSLALSTTAGGRIPVRADARDVQRPTERVFEVRFAPLTVPADVPLDHGARVEVRIPLEGASLASIAWRRIRQALQHHLNV